MILIVDDDPSFLAAAQRTLARHRDTIVARTAAQARDLIRSVGGSVSLVLVDLDLPDEDGFSLIRDLRGRFPDLPVIAISGVSHFHILESAKLLGATEVLEKPIGPDWPGAIERVRTRGVA